MAHISCSIDSMTRADRPLLDRARKLDPGVNCVTLVYPSSSVLTPRTLCFNTINLDVYLRLESRESLPS